jgi:hypothetical protein
MDNLHPEILTDRGAGVDSSRTFRSVAIRHPVKLQHGFPKPFATPRLFWGGHPLKYSALKTIRNIDSGSFP